MSKLTPSRRPGVPHHRARFTARGRWEVVRRVVELEETFAQAAAWANVSKSTVWEWVRRWRAASAAERASLACLAGAFQPPALLAGAGPAEEASRICGCVSAPAGARAGWPMSPRSPVALDGASGAAARRLLAPPAARAAGRGPLPVAVPGPAAAHGHQEARQVRAARPRSHRRPPPPLPAGRLGVRALDRRRLHWLAYSRSTTTRRAATVTAFTERALDFFLGMASSRSG